MRWLTNWRLSLRLARRDAVRARGRSILVLVMIALPVLAVTAADVVMHTVDVSGVESLDLRLGAAEARVTVQDGIDEFVQGFDPDQNSVSSGSGRAKAASRTAVAAVLGGDRPMVEQRSGTIQATTTKGVAHVDATEIDLRDPLAKGLFDLVSGRLPGAPTEVVVNQALADKGYAVGETLDLSDKDAVDPTIVGIAESSTFRDFPTAAGPLDSLAISGLGGTRTWLVGGADVHWTDVRALNDLGASVLSRAVLLDPPPDSELDPQLGQYSSGSDDTIIAVAVLIVVMALIEVVLLAGPAFAVGARRQQRSLALMSSAGGTPVQSRRVVLAGGIVLGGFASILGVVAGIGVGFLLLPIVQNYSGSWLGPFEVPWLQLLGVAVFGLLSALLAAVVPAWIASRQDVVAVLAGRRGDRKPGVRSPLIGLVLLGLGVAGAGYGARASGNGEFFIAASAVLSVLAMILLVPVALGVLSKLSGGLPLTLRYAVRDAARHRSRTVPAVAAVAATVAGVVALGIATSSDEAQNEAMYPPLVAAGVGVVTASGDAGDWATYRRIVEREVPGATVTEVRGITRPADGRNDVSITLVSGQPLLDTQGTLLGSDVLVSDGDLPPGLNGISDAARAEAQHTLAAGGIVAFTNLGARGDQVRLRARSFDGDGKPTSATARATWPAVVIPLEVAGAGPQAVLSSAAADRLGVDIGIVSLTISGTDITGQQEQDTSEALTKASDTSSVYVERGYQSSDETLIILLILAGLGAVLMLGGTLTATFLALSDARPDLATLSSVGASPRMRRGVAAAYALVVGFVGALLGAAVGFIPGIAITYPLTVVGGDNVVIEGSGFATASGVITGPFIDIPWVLILGLVVALPLLTAAIVGLTARSRLPLVARLD